MLTIDGRLEYRTEKHRRAWIMMVHDAGLLYLSAAVELDFCATGSAERDSVEPVCQKIRVADRACLVSQHEEDGLERVFGVVKVAQKLMTEVKNHRAVPRNERGECGFAGGVARPGEAIQELAVREAGD